MQLQKNVLIDCLNMYSNQTSSKGDGRSESRMSSGTNSASSSFSSSDDLATESKERADQHHTLSFSF